MAGYKKTWCRMRTDLARDPAVLSIQRALRFERPELVVGYLHSVWSYFVEQTSDGVARGVTIEDIEQALKAHHFVREMARVGWIKEGIDEDGEPYVCVPEWPKYFGDKDLQRQYEADRKRRQREKSPGQCPGQCPGQKRDNVPQSKSKSKSKKETPHNPPRGEGSYSESFARFWESYPKQRRTGKRAAYSAWQRHVQRPGLVDVVLAAVAEYAASPVGGSAYAKGPTPWLNQHCWEDDRAAWQRGDDPRTAPEAAEASLAAERERERLRTLAAAKTRQNERQAARERCQNGQYRTAVPVSILPGLRSAGDLGSSNGSAGGPPRRN